MSNKAKMSMFQRESIKRILLSILQEIDEETSKVIRDVNQCPCCGNFSTFTIDSRSRGYRKRRYECSVCGHRYNTIEVFSEDLEGWKLPKCPDEFK